MVSSVKPCTLSCSCAVGGVGPAARRPGAYGAPQYAASVAGVPSAPRREPRRAVQTCRHCGARLSASLGPGDRPGSRTGRGASRTHEEACACLSTMFDGMCDVQLYSRELTSANMASNKTEMLLDREDIRQKLAQKR